MTNREQRLQHILKVTENAAQGPWEVDESDVRYKAQAVLNYWGVKVADARLGQRPGECEANAHLIAAAPELLSMLIEAEAELSKMREENAELLSTLIKVRDSFLWEYDDSNLRVDEESENHYFDEICDAINKARAPLGQGGGE